MVQGQEDGASFAVEVVQDVYYRNHKEPSQSLQNVCDFLVDVPLNP